MVTSLYSMQDLDHIKQYNITVCPVSESIHESWLHYPTVSIIFMLLCLESVVFAMVTFFKYNSVRVFNRKIVTANISNNMFIVYFVVMALRYAVDTARFGSHSEENSVNTGLLIVVLVLSGMSSGLLCLALNHQLRHRSIPSNFNSTKVTANETQRSKILRVICPLMTMEVLFMMLFLLNLVTLILVFVHGDITYYWMYLVAIWLQRLPVLILTLRILLQHSHVDGPMASTLFILAMATLLDLVNYLPTNVWSNVLPPNCPFYFLSYLDFFHILLMISMVMYFIFLRAEYLRNQEECIWTTVSQIQDSFDFRGRTF